MRELLKFDRMVINLLSQNTIITHLFHVAAENHKGKNFNLKKFEHASMPQLENAFLFFFLFHYLLLLYCLFFVFLFIGPPNLST
jgi:hypothetical protein